MQPTSGLRSFFALPRAGRDTCLSACDQASISLPRCKPELSDVQPECKSYAFSGPDTKQRPLLAVRPASATGA